MDQPGTSQSKTIKVGEAARLAGLSEQTLRNYAERGLIPCLQNPHNKYRTFWSDDAEALRALTRPK